MRNRWLAGVLVAVAVCAFSAPVAAQSDEEEERVFDFEGDTVAADVLKPDAGVVEAVTRRERKSLIKLRVDFVDEIVQSAEDI